MVTITTMMLLVMPCQITAEPTATEIVDRAIEAAGGEKALNRFFQGGYLIGKKTLMTDGKATFIREAKNEWKGEDYYKRSIVYVHDNQREQFQVITAKNRTWTIHDGKLSEVLAVDLKRANMGNYLRKITHLTCLKSPEFNLLKLPDEKATDGTPLVGLNVSQEGKPDVILLFDKNTWLLHTYRYIDRFDSGRDYATEGQEYHYQRIGNVKVCTTGASFIDGKQVELIEVSKYVLTPEVKAADFYPPGVKE